MNESVETETTSFGKELSKAVAKDVAVNIVGNVAGVALLIGIGLVAQKVQDRKARKENAKK